MSDEISIHALREEGDLQAVLVHNVKDISIHALREEGDIGVNTFLQYAKRFLSTPSARRATSFRSSFNFKDHTKFLSTPSARRATP